MLASELRIEELLQFLPDQGKILLNGSRVVIFETSALGKLRKDLIDTLGIDRAKGFLIRYGWSCGFEAAMSIKEQFRWDNDYEWNNAGPKMHSITGHAMSRPTRTDINRENGTIFYKSIMTNSYEAEQHIQHFGYHNESVCWMLRGYASGYASACLGKRVIFKEVTCIGHGDEHCSIIGRTIEEWGEEIIPELAYYEDNKISEELEAAHLRIMTQNNILEQTVAIHDRLTQCILNGKGVDDITASLAELMKCTVILEDHHLASRSTCYGEYTISKELLTPYLPLVSSPSFEKSSAFYIQQKRPFLITDQYQDLKIYRLVSPILVGSNPLGFVSLLRTELPFSELETIALEHAASVFALQILEDKKIAEIEIRLKGDFMEDLLSGNFSDPKSIINRARGLDYDITLPHRVLVLDIHNFTQLVNSFRHNEKRILQFKTELVNTVQSHLELSGKGIVIHKSDNLIMLVQQDKPDSSEIATRQLAESIIKQVSHQFTKVTLSVGIGSSCVDLAGFHHSYISAKKALEIGKSLNKQGQVISLEQFSAHVLLFSALNPTDLYIFATSQIGSLLAYDKTNQTQLLPTLQEFLNLRGNVEGTARSLNMSVSGFKYRLQRIQEISGQDPKDPQACFNLQLALNILQLVGEDKIK